MFCPNCGTKNADTEAKCAQCGFDLQAKAPQARFKGTMVMGATPAKDPAPPAGGGSTTAKPAGLKGTMIGVAPPEMARALEEAKAKAAAQAAGQAAAQAAVKAAAAAPAAAKPSMKGTMIGVAPPDMQAAIAAAKASAAEPSPAPVPAGKPNIKGTMIGVAPPDMQAAIAAARADIEKRDAGPKTTAKAEPPPTKPQSPLGRAPNSKLKGTMIGVAPPDVSQAIADAKMNAATAPTPRDGVAAAGRPTPNPDLGATMVGTAAPVTESLRPGPTGSRSPSGEFSGTMVGATSPLVESAETQDHDIPDGPDSRAAGNSDHPAAFASTSLSQLSEIEAARANLQRVMAEAEATPRPPNGRDVPTGAQSPAALRSIAQTQKKSALPILILGGALIIVAALIVLALMSRQRPPDEDAVPSAPSAQPAAPAAQ